MSDRTQAEHEGIEEDTRPSTADLVREADDVESRADGTEPGTETTRGTDREPLFEASDRDRFGESWTTIQAAFVDDPRDAVAARGAVGQRRGRLDGGPADRAAALPLVLRPAPLCLSSHRRGCAADGGASPTAE